MFDRKVSSNTEGVSYAIDMLLADMREQDSNSEEYREMTAQLTKLYSLKEIDCKVDAGRRVDMNTLALVTGNILGIAMIVSHERVNVVTSKAVGLLMKLR